MAKQDPQFRANSERGIYITEPLTEALLAKVSPRILELRVNPSEPISVFINSAGGSIRVLDVLDGLLHSRDADGRTSRVVTVALGDANSAAATLLALGDYAIAYRHSRMHFHGSRLPMVEELTAEAASDRAGWLASLNRGIAMRLAKVVMGRLVLRYIRLQPAVGAAQNRVAQFAEALTERVSHVGDKLLRSATRHMTRLGEISGTLQHAGIQESDERLARDAKVFRAILDFEIKEHAGQDWSLDEFGMEDVKADYFLLRDYSFGDHVHHLAAAVDRYGPSFLSEEQFTEFAARAASDSADAVRWLHPLVETAVREFWYFTVCLCRLMQEGENSLSASDAYWLGVVDEVLGTDMVGSRHLIESDAPNTPQAEK